MNTDKDEATARIEDRSGTVTDIELFAIAKALEVDIKEYQEATKGVVRIGLHIITSYSDKSPCNQLIKQFNDNISDTFDRFFKDLSKKYHSLKPNLMLCWKVPTKIIMDVDQTFPGLWAVVKIYPAIKHKGTNL